MTLDTPPLGSFIIHYVVLAMADLTKQKRSLLKSYGGQGPKMPLS